MTDEAGEDISGDWITVREAQKVIGGKRPVTARTVRRWIERHKIPTHRQYREGGYTLLLARQEVEALTDPDKALDKVRARMSELVTMSAMDTFTKKVSTELEAALHAQAEHTRATRRKLRAVTVLAVLALGGAVAVWAAVSMQAVHDKAVMLARIQDTRGELAESTRALAEVRAELAGVKAALRPSGPPPPVQAGRPSPVPRGARRWWELWRD